MEFYFTRPTLICSEFLMLEHAAEYADFGGEAEEEEDEIDHFDRLAE
jgi:hypothetical protein